ncbi:S8 family serine peptidase [Actinoplanes solisilvae]|uniref:S8 family serine peptidase n=1 Tax=Actinoplanes solisilvae TaxID=2486853 RepID=UPI000FDA09D0|nr:S8 family serine peptidase [Actinoplanes solisilvae]
MSSRRRLWAAAAVLTLVGGFVATPASAAAPAPAAEVDPRLLQELARPSAGDVTFFVDLADRGTLKLGGAKERVARTREVIAQKREHADRTQSAVRILLRDRGAAFTPYWISNTVEVTGDLELVRELARRDDVSRISLPAVAQTVDPAPTTASKKAELPWGLTQIGADKVWNGYGVHGEGVVVGSVDTGVQFDHPALARQYRGTNADGTVTHAGNWFDATGTCPEAGVPCDDVGHGTHTVGTMAGDGIGVAPGAKWIAAKGCATNGCAEGDLLAAGQWMLAPDGRPELSPDIVNNSWGGPENGNRFYDDIVTAWTSAGIFPVFSNGNDGEYGCGTAGYPATNPSTYAVGAYSSNGTIAYFSSRGNGPSIRPDIAAPGVDVLSSVPGSGYALNSGTSMAAPHVAGAVALLWSAQPDVRRDVQATRELLDRTAGDADDTSCGGTAADNNVFGEGRLDAYALVEAATGGAHGGVTVTVTGAGAVMSGALVTLTSALITRSGRTGADGVAQLGRVPGGSYTLTIAGFGRRTVTQPLTVAAEQPRVTVDLSAAATWHPVSGIVRDPAGKGLAGVRVTLAGESFAGFVTGANGRFTGQLPEGRYDVLVDYGRWLAPKTVPLTVDSAETLDVRLEAKTDQFGYTLAESPVRLVHGGRRVSPGAIELPFPVTFYGVTYREVTVRADGSLTFGESGAAIRGVAPRKHAEIRIHPSSSTFMVTWGDVQIALASTGSITAQGSATIQDERGRSLSYEGPLAVTFSVPGAGLLRGRVLDANDGQPVEGAAVTVSPEIVTTSGADGVYQVQAPAGPLTASVTKSAYGEGTLTAAVRAGAVRVADVRLETPLLTAPSKQPVTVKAGGTATIDVTLRNRGGLPATYTARELNGPKPDGEPGKVLGSFNVPDFYNAYGVDWHDGKLLVSDTYFWGRVERFTENGTSLGKGAITMNGWPSDMTPMRGLVCAPSMSIVGDLPIVCLDRETLEVKATIPTPRPGALYYGLAYRESDDTFYLAGDYAIRHIAGLTHATPGEVLGECQPVVPWTTGIELDRKQNVLWTINQDNVGERIRALDPDTCTELGWAPDPDADELSAGGITLDDQGDLWTVGQTRAPYRAAVYHLSGQLPVYSDIPWLTMAAPTGSIDADGHGKLRLSVDTTGLRPGKYTATLLLISNGAAAGTVPVTVSLTVR